MLKANVLTDDIFPKFTYKSPYYIIYTIKHKPQIRGLKELVLENSYVVFVLCSGHFALFLLVIKTPDIKPFDGHYE